MPTLHGAPVTVRVPAGTPNGRTFRVRGKGVPRKDGSHGDLMVTVDVQVPAVLDAKAREAVEALRDAIGQLRPEGPTLRGGGRCLGSWASSRAPTCPSTSSAWPRSSPGSTRRRFAPTTVSGLVSPGRTGGGGRRYSWRDIETLREVAELTVGRHRARRGAPHPPPGDRGGDAAHAGPGARGPARRRRARTAPDPVGAWRREPARRIRAPGPGRRGLAAGPSLTTGGREPWNASKFTTKSQEAIAGARAVRRGRRPRPGRDRCTCSSRCCGRPTGSPRRC